MECEDTSNTQYYTADLQSAYASSSRKGGKDNSSDVALGEGIDESDKGHELAMVAWAKVEAGFERRSPYCVVDVEGEGHKYSDED